MRLPAGVHLLALKVFLLGLDVDTADVADEQYRQDDANDSKRIGTSVADGYRGACVSDLSECFLRSSKSRVLVTAP